MANSQQQMAFAQNLLLWYNDAQDAIQQKTSTLFYEVRFEPKHLDLLEFLVDMYLIEINIEKSIRLFFSHC
jgi:hypothetical protein